MPRDAALSLGDEFPRPTSDEWLRLVDGVLKGRSFEKVLVSATYDGIEIQPLYTAETTSGIVGEVPGQTPFTRGRTSAGHVDGAWDVRATHSHPDPSVANAQMLEDLEGGVTSLALRLDVFGQGEIDGVVVASLEDLVGLLDGVLVDVAPVALEAGSAFGTAAEWFATWCEHRGVAPEDVAGSLGADPLGALAAGGRLPQGLEAALGEMTELATRCAAGHPRLTAVNIDAGIYSDAGASEAQEIAAVLATGAEYLRAMRRGGLVIGEAAGQIAAVLSADTDVFATIAKQRAMRRCWAHLVDAASATTGGEGSALVLSARTATRIMSRRDPWVNMLRTTAACFAAGVGGADSITVQPFDAALGLPGDLGRRLARNTQLVLQEESHIGRVIDPAGGSWYIESLTDSLSAAAWAMFQRIEAAGGMAAVLADGSLAGELADVRRGRTANIAHRRDPLTGVSEFPNLAEQSVAVEAVDRDGLRRAARDRTGGRRSAVGPATVIDPLPRHRLAEQFEALRDASDAVVAATGERPRVFLANLSSPAEYTARATFARNLFEAGGIEAVLSDGLDDPADVAEALASSGSQLAVICSSDRVVEQSAAKFAAALREAGATRVYLAGKPGERRDELTSNGVDEFIHVGIDAIDTLRRALEALGVAIATDAEPIDGTENNGGTP